jgi:23S rRNA G2069 N7-methylase RlmK/C1962 C5-methylase RlmI
VLEWLTENPEPKFDLIILDPPTFSNTKSTDQTLDIQRDHSALINASSKWLALKGSIYFSNNFKGFALDESVSERFIVKDLTRASIDLDFDRRAPHSLIKLSPKTVGE